MEFGVSFPSDWTRWRPGPHQQKLKWPCKASKYAPQCAGHNDEGEAFKTFAWGMMSYLNHNYSASENRGELFTFPACPALCPRPH